MLFNRIAEEDNNSVCRCNHHTLFGWHPSMGVTKEVAAKKHQQRGEDREKEQA